LNNVSAPNNGQTIEYAISTENVAPANSWQTFITFTGLNENTTYYIFARSKENDNFYVGVVSVSLKVTTDAKTSAPVISVAALVDGTVGIVYTVTLDASGDTPIVWSLPVGSLPDDLTLSEAGVISGTPTKAGTFNFTVTASNSAGEDTKQFSIVIIKGKGATIGTPSLARKTYYSLTINAISVPDNKQLVEYTSNIINDVLVSNWQIGLIFTGLSADTRYYIFARAAENDNYFAGEVSPPLLVTTNQAPITSSDELPQTNLLKAWIRDGLLHVTGLTIGDTFSVYSVTGTLVYQGMATSGEADIPLKAQGVYLVQQGDHTVRVVVQ